MNKLITKYQKIIDKLPVEARAIILAAALGFVFILWYYGFWKSLRADTLKAKTSIQTLNSTTPLLEKQIKATTIALKEKKEQDAKDRTANKDKANKTKTNGSPQLISPQKINEVLQDLLTTRYRLILLELKNLPPKTAVLPQINKKIFEHSIIIKFQGDYFSTMNYLQAIEELGWRIFWDKLEYRVVQYPMAEITLQIHTLSDQGDWIDV